MFDIKPKGKYKYSLTALLGVVTLICLFQFFKGTKYTFHIQPFNSPQSWQRRQSIDQRYDKMVTHSRTSEVVLEMPQLEKNRAANIPTSELRDRQNDKTVPGTERGKQLDKTNKKTAVVNVSIKESHNRENVTTIPVIEWKPPTDAGEQGRGVTINQTLLSADQKYMISQGLWAHGFNLFLSDRISLHRSLPPRLLEKECSSVRYRYDLPATSVVIIFHNEAWSTLLRTVHSVLDRSPPHVLKAVLLVDDFSDQGHLGKLLDAYVSELAGGKVKVLRSLSRGGLIKARLLGLSEVTTPTVVFLDSHCECAPGWLEPLLSRLAENPTAVVVPRILNIDAKTFQYQQGSGKYIHVGSFTWKLLFRWIPVQRQERTRRKSDIEPIRSPAMAGGLFAINKDFFLRLGTYDTGMKIWGGENLELSFKTWMCGGTLEMVPCSNVGHVFRIRAVPEYHEHHLFNLARLAHVWLDDYINVYYLARPKARDVHPGDVSERREVRRRLKCHDFKWYLKTIVPEMYLKAVHRLAQARKSESKDNGTTKG